MLRIDFSGQDGSRESSSKASAVVQVEDNGSWLNELTWREVGRFWVYSQGKAMKFADEEDKAGGKVGSLFFRSLSHWTDGSRLDGDRKSRHNGGEKKQKFSFGHIKK